MKFSIALDQVIFYSRIELSLIAATKSRGLFSTQSSSGTVPKLKHTPYLLSHVLISHGSDKVKLPVFSKINCLKFSRRAISFWLKIIISSTSCQLLDIFCQLPTLSSQSACLESHLSVTNLTYHPHIGKVNFDWSSGVK